MIYIGIDPGMSGGIVMLDAAGSADFVAAKEGEKGLALFLQGANGYERFAMLEQVHSMPKQGVASSFKFGVSYGFLRGLLVAECVPFETVTPQKWQKAMGCLSRGDKNVTKRKAQELFPMLVITHVNADAFLLAEYCRRTVAARTPEEIKAV